MSYNPYRPFCSYWWRYWLHLPQDIKWFFKRIYLYRSFLWNDNDYDYAAFLHIMRFKLRRLRKHMEEHAITAHAEDRVAELAHADVLLRNIVDEDPDDEWSMHCDQWHSLRDDDWDLSKCGAGKDVCTKACMDSFERQKQNWHKLWVYIEKHMQGWWD